MYDSQPPWTRECSIYVLREIVSKAFALSQGMLCKSQRLILRVIELTLRAICFDLEERSVFRTAERFCNFITLSED